MGAIVSTTSFFELFFKCLLQVLVLLLHSTYLMSDFLNAPVFWWLKFVYEIGFVRFFQYFIISLNVKEPENLSSLHTWRCFSAASCSYYAAVCVLYRWAICLLIVSVLPIFKSTCFFYNSSKQPLQIIYRFTVKILDEHTILDKMLYTNPIN